MFLFLWGRGQWFSLKFSLSQENDYVPKSLDGQGTQAMNLVQRLCSVLDSSAVEGDLCFSCSELYVKGRGAERSREGGKWLTPHTVLQLSASVSLRISNMGPLPVCQFPCLLAQVLSSRTVSRPSWCSFLPQAGSEHTALLSVHPLPPKLNSFRQQCHATQAGVGGRGEAAVSPLSLRTKEHAAHPSSLTLTFTARTHTHRHQETGSHSLYFSLPSSLDTLLFIEILLPNEFSLVVKLQ